MDDVRAWRRHAYLVGLAVAACLTVVPPAHADLTDPTLLAQFDPLEVEAAFANQAIYNALVGTPNSPGICAGLAIGARPPVGTGGGGSPQCTGATLQVFENVRSLVATADNLESGAPTNPYGLGLNAYGLGNALKWTAAEEVLAEGEIARRFANNQTSSLWSRVGAIRTISRASLQAHNLDDPSEGALYANAGTVRGGGASADGNGGVTRWGIFGDSAGGWGNRKPTNYEDAHKFDGQEYTGGIDYRVSDSLVWGAIVGYSNRHLNFDSSLSVVDGGITSDGTSGMLFLQWDKLHFYATAAVGLQTLNYDVTRTVKYPSLNPTIPSDNTVERGQTKSSSTLATLNLGIPFEWKRFAADLYVKGDYQHVKVNAFTETQVVESMSLNSPGFQQTVDGQTLPSFDVAAGIKLSVVLTPRFGVFIPYVRGEYHRELENQGSTLNTVYAGLPAAVLAALAAAHSSGFSLNPDSVNPGYYVVTGGISAVIRGSQRVDASGVAHGGLQGYLQFSRVLRLQYFTDSVFGGGLRYEF
jgi:hypothetical protein